MSPLLERTTILRLLLLWLAPLGGVGLICCGESVHLMHGETPCREKKRRDTDTFRIWVDYQEISAVYFNFLLTPHEHG